MLLVVIGLVTACRLAGPAPSMPASFTDDIRNSGLTFQAATRAAGTISEAEVISALRAADTSFVMLQQPRAMPVYGVLTCIDDVAPCEPGPAGFLGDRARDVWVVVFPDWVAPDGDVGWVIVDAATGLEFGFGFHDPRED